MAVLPVVAGPVTRTEFQALVRQVTTLERQLNEIRRLFPKPPRGDDGGGGDSGGSSGSDGSI